jgi:hypothetical protein
MVLFGHRRAHAVVGGSAPLGDERPAAALAIMMTLLGCLAGRVRRIARERAAHKD